jgi:enoyl-[acyl-carrier protein] reductase I
MARRACDTARLAHQTSREIAGAGAQPPAGLKRRRALPRALDKAWLARDETCMLSIDLSGKRALVAGVGDDAGLGFSIAKALAEAGAAVCVATWPPALGIFETLLRRGKMAESLRFESGEGVLSFERVYPLDADFDSEADMPADVREHRRYKDLGDVSIDGLVRRVQSDFGEGALDIVVHSLANGPEVRKPLLETSRKGYLSASGTSAYSFVSLVQRFGPVMRPSGSFLALTYIAAERVIPGYGGGMSSAKAALESDTRTLAFEAGRKWGHRVNVISAGPYASRAASAIGFIGSMIEYCSKHTPLPEPIKAREVGAAAAFLSSPLASGITGHTLYVDMGYLAMGAPADLLSLANQA